MNEIHNEIQAREKLKQINAENLLVFYDQLSSSQSNSLIKQIDSINPVHLSQQRELLNKDVEHEKFKPLKKFTEIGTSEDIHSGKNLIAEGRVGCLVMAGGQGTRLGFDGPKGMFPISIIKNKTLFQLLADKVTAASNAYGKPLKIAFMTSPQNDKQTREYFLENKYFGLDPSQISFFVQGTLPFLDANGNLFLENTDKIAVGPDGNGLLLHRFVSSGIYTEWKQSGIEYVNVLLIDNPLAEPFDAELIGYQSRKQVEVVVKAIFREDPLESVGVLVTNQEDKLKVIEYSEISESERTARLEDGHLLHRCANISLFSFSMDFIKRVTDIKQMPLHKAFKAAKKLDDQNNKAWKFETFIFDLLPFANSSSVLVYPRSECFAPLKQAEGLNSPDTVRAALLAKDRVVYKKVTGKEPPEYPMELEASFYYSDL